MINILKELYMILFVDPKQRAIKKELQALREYVESEIKLSYGK